MVKEYIQQKKEETEAEILEKQEELKKLLETEKIIREDIERIRQSDIDFEIFSPRTGEVSLREKISNLEERLRKIRGEKAEVQKNIEKLLEKKTDFEKMLQELEECFT